MDKVEIYLKPWSYQKTATVCVVAKFGLPNCRMKMLFSCVPYARRLGLLHYQMTRTRTVSAEEVAIQSSSSSSSWVAAAAAAGMSDWQWLTAWLWWHGVTMHQSHPCSCSVSVSALFSILLGKIYVLHELFILLLPCVHRLHRHPAFPASSCTLLVN